MTDLVLPNGRPVSDFYKAHPGDGSARVVGLSPWITNSQGAVRGATSKKGNWKDYYDMYRRHSIVRSAVDKIAKTATNVGFDYVPRDSRAKIKKRELTVLQAFFEQQHDLSYELRRIYKDLLICGDAYLYIVRDRRKRPVKLKRIAPKTIHIQAKANGEVIAYFQKNPDAIMEEPIRFEADEILHFRIDDPDNDLYGLSPLESLKDAVAADIYAQIYNGAFFRNSAVTGTIIAVRNANPDEVQRNRKWLEENYTGPEAAHKPLVIEGESVDVKKAVTSHSEMGFLEGRRFIIQEILAVLDVPPTKVGLMENANRSNSKEQDKTFRVESVTPLQHVVESVINDHFVRGVLGVENTIIKHSEADTRDQIEQMDYFTKGEAWGVFSPNEIRAKLGMAPVDGGDTNFIMAPTGAVPLDRMQLYFQIPQTNIEDVPPTEEDPVEGEPAPEGGSTQIRSGASRGVKSLSVPLSLQGCLLKLSLALTDDNALRQAYSYAMDAIETGDTRVINAADALGKACRTQDHILKQGYIERAHEAMSHFIRPVDTTLLAKNEENEDDE